MRRMGDSTPICRCRVLYLGSAVPRQSKDGLQGIQEPLKSLYPNEGAVGAKGIDSWLSVWSNGILLENVDENLKQITRFFPIESLHYCAAVRQVLIPERGNNNPEPKFLPLDSPFARMPRAHHPPIFAAILRRTTGIKVLECHVFICKREAAANALVRCCFHAYADNSYARQLESGNGSDGISVYGTLKSGAGNSSKGNLMMQAGGASNGGWRSRTGSTTTMNSVGRTSNGHMLLNGNGPMNHENDGRRSGAGSHNSSAVEGYTSVKNYYGSTADLDVTDDGENSIYNDENHKVWNGSQDHLDGMPLESPYEVYPGSHSTLGRPSRPRQISAPVPVPPPPVKEETKKKKEKKFSTSKSGSSQSLSGTLIRPKPMHPSTLQRHHHQPPPPPHHPMMYGGPMPPPNNPRQYHTISHRGFPPPHHMMNHPMMPPPPQGPPQMHPMQVPVMLPQQYATLQPTRSTLSSKKKKKDKKMKNGIPVGMPLVPPIYAFAPPPHGFHPSAPQSMIGEPRPLAMSNRKHAQSMGNGLDDSGNSGAESPGGTGIYRRKGHMNERAFSYSIRQEHRSRSHGSLASLQFNPPDLKKEREIAQMVAGLDLHDNDQHSQATIHRKQSNGSGVLLANGGPNSMYGPGIPATALYGVTTNGPASSFGKPPRR